MGGPDSDVTGTGRHAAGIAFPRRAFVVRPAATGRSDVSRSQFLTPKETQILKLLSIGRPNKLIARTLAISDETVKWHMKNLFLKLSAGSRSHAVDRARLLGLLDG